MGAADRRLDAHARHPPGPRPGARRRPRPALGPGRGVHRRGPVPRRHHRHLLRARAAVGRGARHAQALRRLLGLAGRAQLRPGARRPARARRRAARPVRDGGPRRRGPVGHALLRRDRRRARRRRPRPAHRACCASGGASTAPSSPTTSAWRSCTCCTTSRPTSARRPRWRSPPASTSSCPPATPTSAPLAAAVRDGRVDEALVDRAVLRALRQKEELGLLDATFEDEPPADGRPRRAASTAQVAAPAGGGVGGAARQRRHPAARPAPPRSRSSAPTPTASRRCSAATPSSTTSSRSTPGTAAGIVVPTVREALAGEWPSARLSVARGLRGRRRRRQRHRRMPSPPRARLGGRGASSSATTSGLFGRGTVGEGCDRDDLELPGVQRRARGGRARHGDAGGARAAHRAAVRRRLGARAAAPPWCRPSSPARRAPRRSPACCPGGSTPRGGCR